jgi:hypothetical protein
MERAMETIRSPVLLFSAAGFVEMISGSESTTMV